MTKSGDADQLQAIQDLARAIESKQPALTSARARRDADAAQLQVRKGALRQIELQITAIHTACYRSESSVYLNSGALERGTFTLGNYAVTFRGWRGDVTVPLRNIVTIEQGTSNLPSRAGVPVIGRLWPGKTRTRQTIIASLQGPGGGSDALMVIADLHDASGWSDAIVERQAQVANVAARQSALAADRADAGRLVAAAAERLSASQAEAHAIEQDVAVLGRQKAQLESQQRQIDAARQRQSQQVTSAAKQKGKRR